MFSMNIPKYALENPTITVTATVILMFWGVYTFYTVPRNEDPQYQIRTCVVGTSWPAASAQKVEQLITVPLEKAIGTMVEVRRLRSESKVGTSAIYVDLEQRGIKSVNDVWQKLRNKVQEVIPLLPPGCSPPYVATEFGEVEAMMLALYSLSPQYGPRDLRKYAKIIQSQLSPLPMMGRVQVMGVQDEVINLEVSSGVWSKLNISTEQLAYALQERNIVEPGGSLDTKLGQFIVRLTGEFQTTKQIETVTVGALEEQSPTYLSDLGIKVNRSYPNPPTFFCRYSDREMGRRGFNCLIVSFNMKRGGNLIELGEIVNKKIAEINDKMLPPDVRLSVVADQPAQVQTSIGSLFTNLFQSAFVVLAIGFLLTSARLALIMALSIPFVLTPTLGIMRFFGIELEGVSIASLIVALGMVVDNGIETSENVHRLMTEGKSRFEAAWQGCNQVSMSIFTATLTTVAAFTPLLIIPGELGEFIYSLPVTVSVALLLSWLYALSVNALFCYWFVEPTVVQGGALAFVVRFWIGAVAVISRIRQGQGDIISFTRKLWTWVAGKKTITEGDEGGAIRNWYGNFLPKCVKHRYLTMTVCGLILASGLFFGSIIPDQFFPLAFRDQFLIDIWLPAGTTIQRTDEVTQQVEDIIKSLSLTNVPGEGQVERLRNLTAFIGSSVPRFYITVDPMPDNPAFAQILVNTTLPDYTDQYITDIRERAERDVVGARVIVKKLNLGTLTGAPVALRLLGPDVNELRPLAKNLKKFLARQEEVVDIYDDWGEPAYQLEIEVNVDRANMAGVSNRDVMKTMNTFLAGQYLTSFQEDDIQIPVYLRIPREERDALGYLQNFYVEGRVGRVPIDGLASNKLGFAESTLVRRNQQRAMTVYAYVLADAYPNEVIRRLLPDIEKMQEDIQKRLPGYRLEVGGEWEETRASDGDVAIAFNIALLLIALVLIWQYNGILRPILVLLAVTMGLTGGCIGLWLTGWPLNFMATLGLIAISGVVVNDSICLIDFTDDFRKNSGLPLAEAVVKAARFRIIPIFLTSFTTIGGLYTLSGPLWGPMRDAMAFGLFFETILTLFVIPCLYYILACDLKILKER
jgi:multidrug efflux pump subunit AcrB